MGAFKTAFKTAFGAATISTGFVAITFHSEPAKKFVLGQVPQIEPYLNQAHGYYSHALDKGRNLTVDDLKNSAENAKKYFEETAESTKNSIEIAKNNFEKTVDSIKSFAENPRLPSFPSAVQDKKESSQNLKETKKLDSPVKAEVAVEIPVSPPASSPLPLPVPVTFPVTPAPEQITKEPLKPAIDEKEHEELLKKLEKLNSQIEALEKQNSSKSAEIQKLNTIVSTTLKSLETNYISKLNTMQRQYDLVVKHLKASSVTAEKHLESLRRVKHLETLLKQLQDLTGNVHDLNTEYSRAMNIASVISNLSVPENAHIFSKKADLIAQDEFTRVMMQEIAKIGKIEDSVDNLKHDFEKVVRKVERVSFAPNEGGFTSLVSSAFLSLFSFRLLGVSYGLRDTETEQTLNRVRECMEEDDLIAALNEVNKLEGWKRLVSQDWIERLRNYLHYYQSLCALDAHLALVLQRKV